MPETNILEIWIKRIAEEKMPVLSHTVAAIARIVEDDYSPRSALTNIILQDPGMTSHVLRLANSVYYSPHGTTARLNTISRAVVVLGVDVIKSICITVAIINELIRGESKEHLIQEMARSFHAAVQARDISEEKGEKQVEEIFIAALLYRIGEMAFWVFGDHLREALDAELSNPELSPGEAEQAILGFRLSQLSAGLCKEWNLGELVQTTIKGLGGPHSNARCIVLCYRLAKAVESGWNTPEVEKIIRELALNSGIPVDKLRARLEKNAQEAIVVASEYGAISAARHIPLPEEIKPPKIVAPEPVKIEISEINEPDPMLQLRILRELSTLLTKDIDGPSIIDMILEGIFRGIGMDRAVFCILSPDRSQLKAKIALGLDREKLTTSFVVKLTKDDPNIFAGLLEKKKQVWFPDKMPSEIKPLIPESVVKILGTPSFFAAPIIVEGKSVGMIYADRGISNRPLDIDSFESFTHFTLQANLSLDFLGSKPTGEKIIF